MTERYQVHHNPTANRFEIQVEGQLAVLEYRMDGNTINFTHTLVPAELEGRGIGSQLAQAALEYTREMSFKVFVTCWFVAGYIERHPEYKSLL